jgi:hypothetical protein
MCFSKIITARVALGIASQDEVSRVRAHALTCVGCREKIQKLTEAATAVAGPFCMSKEDLLRSAEAPVVSDEEDEHLRSCRRCSEIGFTIFHLPSTEDNGLISLS